MIHVYDTLTITVTFTLTHATFLHNKYILSLLLVHFVESKSEPPLNIMYIL